MNHNLDTHTNTVTKEKETVRGVDYIVITSCRIDKRYIPFDKYKEITDVRLASIQTEKADIERL